MKCSTFGESFLYIKIAKLALSESLSSLQVSGNALNICSLKGKKFSQSCSGSSFGERSGVSALVCSTARHYCLQAV